ncbi:MAG: futalosine hydrolase [Gemmatimonadetes bacterium]|nr:futalosine hydrolase [Gemmatimonadota bacterium]
MSPTVLVVAATPQELAPPDGWETLVCGVGPVEAALATARRLAVAPPAALLHVGIAGARRARGLPLRSLVVGADARYSDLGVGPEWAPGVVAPDAALLRAVRAALPDAPVLRIGTSGRVGGTRGCDVEAMEGFAVLRAAQAAGVPAVEVRAVSNAVEEPDRAHWDIAGALAAVTAVTPALVTAMRAAIAEAGHG